MKPIAGDRGSRRDLIRIGEFARLSALSVHQLRHYHEVGLLMPAAVDEESGYRYYEGAQVTRAEVIAILRSIDTPLQEIRSVLADPRKEIVDRTLDSQRARLERRLNEARDRLQLLEKIALENRLMKEQSRDRLVEVRVERVMAIKDDAALWWMDAGRSGGEGDEWEVLDGARQGVLLTDAAEARKLSVWIGPAEANGIAVALKGVSTGRPLTHDLVAQMLAAFAIEVTNAAITHLQEGTYHATLRAKMGEQEKELDARPSDAINIAMRVGAPILVAEDLLAPREEFDPWGVEVFEEHTSDRRLAVLMVREVPPPGVRLRVKAEGRPDMVREVVTGVTRPPGELGRIDVRPVADHTVSDVN